MLRGDLARTGGDASLQSQVLAWYEGVWGDGPPDARLHVGVNCASRGCPDLQIGAYQGPTVWQQLDEAATRFVDNPSKGAGPDGISELFSWFAEDFERSGGIEAFVQRHRTEGTSGVDFDAVLPYDWSLNKADP